MVDLDFEAEDVAVLRFHQPYGQDDEQRYLAALEELARAPHPFVLLTILGGGPAMSQAGERAQALWFKRTREQMNARCRVCVMVRPDATEESAAKFRRLWSFPVFATRDEAVGRALLASHRDATARAGEEA